MNSGPTIGWTGGSSSLQEWSRAREDATRGRPKGAPGGNPLKPLFGRPAVNAGLQAGDGVENSR